MTVSELDAPALPATMDVMEAIRGRRSVGKMRQDLPPREAIETILDAGTWAPCHHVTEPWRFSVNWAPELEVQFNWRWPMSEQLALDADLEMLEKRLISIRPPGCWI